MAFLDRFKSLLAGDKPATARPPAQTTAQTLDAPDTSGKDESALREAMRLIDEGNRIENAGRPDEAMSRYDAAVALVPTLARAHINRANVLASYGRIEDAIAGYRVALQHDPTSAGAHYNLGNALVTLARTDEALGEFDRALQSRPEFTDAEVARGNLLDDIGRLDEAVAAYRRALAMQPDYAQVHSNLAATLLRQGRIADAKASLRTAIDIDPGYASAHANLANALAANGELREAFAEYRRATQLDPDNLHALSGLVFTSNYLSDGSRESTLAEAERYGERASRLAPPFRDWPNTPDPDRRLKIGFVSGDMRDHPAGYFLESVLTGLRAVGEDALELFAYSNHLESTATTIRIRDAVHHWSVVKGLDDAQLAATVRADGIDILLDLSGHTAHHRLTAFARKPAPLQASWLGYFATTGVPAINYFIADPIALPESAEADFTESIWRLPETRLCFTPPSGEHPVAALPALERGTITFGCFGHLTKVNDGVIALWSRVLKAVPASRMRLKAPQLADAANRDAMLARFAAHGIDAARLDLEGPSSRAEYLDAYGGIDIVLDTFPYPGGTTTAEALWMGVPVLTLAGESFLSRQGASLLTNAGLPGWIATDADGFVALAVAHASDAPRLSELRKGLRGQVLASPLFDAERFARHFQAALRGMWRQWCRHRAGLPPEAAP